MKNFERANVAVMYDVETLEFQNMKDETMKEPITVTSKSELFRQLYNAGMDICDIAKGCNSHYSFVYGVISNSTEIRKVSRQTASDEIRLLASQGMSAGDIAKKLNKNYSFVFGVVKKYKASASYDPSVPVISTTGLVVQMPEERMDVENFAQLAPESPDPDENIVKKQVKKSRAKKEEKGEVAE